jgi:RNA polymerase sigma-70 factor (sigma-E family)
MAVRQPRVGEVSTADEAVDALYRAHGLRIVRLAYLLTGDAAVAEEIAQEGFVRLWRSWDRIRDADAAYAYLRSTVVNLSRSLLRRKALEVRHRVTRRVDAVEIEDVAGRIDALHAVARLPSRQRACVALRFFEDMTEAETAHALGITVGTVKSQTHKALRRLGELMSGEDIDD